MSIADLDEAELKLDEVAASITFTQFDEQSLYEIEIESSEDEG